MFYPMIPKFLDAAGLISRLAFFVMNLVLEAALQWTLAGTVIKSDFNPNLNYTPNPDLKLRPKSYFSCFHEMFIL